MIVRNQVLILLILLCCSLSTVTSAQSINIEECRRLASETQINILTQSKQMGDDKRNDSANRIADNRGDRIRLSKDVFVVYSVSGDVCYQSRPRIKEGDAVHVGIFGTGNERKELRGTT